MGDLCVLGPGSQDKNGNYKFAEGQPLVDKEGKPKLDADGNQLFAERDSTTWDTQTYLYYMGHSVFNHIDAVQEANRLADTEAFRDPVNYKNWRLPTKKTSKAQEVSPYVPVNILYFQNFVEEVLNPNCANPRELIKQNAEMLAYFSMGGEDDGIKEEVLDEFFTF